MTNTETQAIAERAEKSTAYPPDEDLLADYFESREDAAFYVHARPDILALLDERAALMGLLVQAVIPLEALRATEMDGWALCPEVKVGICEALAAIRSRIQAAASGEREGV